MTIIGVVGDVRQLGPERESMPECYMTYEQHPFNGLTLSIVARTTGDPGTFSKTLRRLAHERSTDVPDEVHDDGSHAFRSLGCAQIPHSVVCSFREFGSMSCRGRSLWGHGVLRSTANRGDRCTNRVGGRPPALWFGSSSGRDWLLQVSV